MNFTAKEDYGLRAVLDLAVYAGNGPVQTREIAARQRIPEQFLEQLLAALRRAEIVRSTRGAGGGYSLATTPDRVTVGQVLRALSGPLVPTELVTGDADPGTRDIPEASVVRSIWESLRAALREVADNTTFQDLLDQRAASLREAAYMMNI
ncbi:MAG: Rrf2 family transcriptional regulator [Armatimonadaceae bacterium]